MTQKKLYQVFLLRQSLRLCHLHLEDSFCFRNQFKHTLLWDDKTLFCQVVEFTKHALKIVTSVWGNLILTFSVFLVQHAAQDESNKSGGDDCIADMQVRQTTHFHNFRATYPAMYAKILYLKSFIDEKWLSTSMRCPFLLSSIIVIQIQN